MLMWQLLQVWQVLWCRSGRRVGCSVFLGWWSVCGGGCRCGRWRITCIGKNNYELWIMNYEGACSEFLTLISMNLPLISQKFWQWYTIELCRPVPTRRDKSLLVLWLIPFYVGFHPTLIYVAPSGLAFISMNLPLISQKTHYLTIWLNLSPLRGSKEGAL